MPMVPRDDWFDRLARSAALPRKSRSNESDGMSRRDVVGIFTIASTMAILGSWARPRRAFGATVQPGSDPGCDGIRTFYKEGCAKKVPKLNFRPNINGCGPQTGINLVPQAPLFLASFTPACNTHDVGYATCNRPKAVTDQKFLEDMKTICAGPGTPLPGGIIDGFVMSVLMTQCIRNAEIFYAAVSSLGDDPYKEGQAESCDCCAECPGDAVKCNGTCCRPGFICSAKGFCCEPCKNGWIACPESAGEWARCGFGCCNPATPVCCPVRTPGNTTCCPGKCSGTGCG